MSDGRYQIFFEISLYKSLRKLRNLLFSAVPFLRQVCTLGTSPKRKEGAEFTQGKIKSNIYHLTSKNSKVFFLQII